MKKRHLRLVSSCCEKSENNKKNSSYSEMVRDFFECIFLSKNEKIYIIKDSLIKIYKDYEETTGIIDVPYFVKAERRMSQIIKARKVNYYYCRLKKFQNYTL